MRHAVRLLPLLALIAGACDPTRQQEAEAGTAAAELERLRAAPGYIIDSIHPPAEELRRFRQGMTEVTALRNGAPSRDEAVARLFRAFADADTLGIRALHLDVEEFAWLYFPHSPYVEPKHQLPPGLAWFHVTAESNKGSARAVRAIAGRSAQYRGYTCDPEPQPWGTGQLWGSCTVQWSEDGRDWDVRLFGSIIEHDGRYKFVSYANRL